MDRAVRDSDVLNRSPPSRPAASVLGDGTSRYRGDRGRRHTLLVRGPDRLRNLESRQAEPRTLASRVPLRRTLRRSLSKRDALFLETNT